MTSRREMTPVRGPVVGSIRPPGSKSITNRALIVAALASGRSRLRGVLDSNDTRVMLSSLQRLGIDASHDVHDSSVVINGCAGHIPARTCRLYVENSGTSIRFLTAMVTTGSGTFSLDGNSRMRERPIRDLAETLNSLGSHVVCSETGCPPVRVTADGLPGGHASIAGGISSQYLSALLMAAPAARNPVELGVEHELVSKPYVDMTTGVMREFGINVTSHGYEKFLIESQTYQACDFEIEPDASAAGYFFAVAAVTGGEVTVEGLSEASLQGDIRFAGILEQMGCKVTWNEDSVTVQGGTLHGIDVDMNEISDTAQTLAAVAVFADSPTRIRNVAHMRHKETDRIDAVASELRRASIQVETTRDGLVVHPGTLRPAEIRTYADHRMAMSFSLLGLRVPGICILNPECTAKTYPRYFDDLSQLCGESS